jgi:hypothetical protein
MHILQRTRGYLVRVCVGLLAGFCACFVVLRKTQAICLCHKLFAPLCFTSNAHDVTPLPRQMRPFLSKNTQQQLQAVALMHYMDLFVLRSLRQVSHTV